MTSMELELLLWVRFSYAGSVRGEPQVTFPIKHAGVPVDFLVAMAVERMEIVGSDYHHCQSMPSLDGDQYVMAQGEKLITSLEDLAIEGSVVFPPRSMAKAELLYVGPFEAFQINQCLSLGGTKSLDRARYEWQRSRDLVSRTVA